MTDREPLPQRRDQIIETIEFGDHAIELGVGLYEDGRPGEIFLAGVKGDLGLVAADLAVIVSLALQHGVKPQALAKSIGRQPLPDNSRVVPASLVGAVVDRLVQISAKLE